MSHFSWSQWSKWPIACSTTCRLGQRCRVRKCQDSHGRNVEIVNCGKVTEGRHCQKCLNKGICPVDAHWSNWRPWTECQVANRNCGTGTRTRVRRCDNPKPKYDGMLCMGNSSEVEACKIACDNEIKAALVINDLINKQFANLLYNVLLKSEGDSLTLDCFSDAYASANMGNKKLYVLWNFNGIPIRTMHEMVMEDILKLQRKFQFLGITQASFMAPRGHYKFSGSKLIIESLTSNDSGVYTCILNYDYIEYVNLFFTVIVPYSYKSAFEYDLFLFNSNTEGLENIEYFDAAEIRWFLNRRLIFTGLLVEFSNRFLEYYVNKSFEGSWECHLYADFRKNQHWIVNKFYMKIKNPRSIWQKLSDNESLKQICYFLLLGIFSVIIIFATSLIVVKYQTKTRLNLEKQQEIIHEETENNRLMLMVARKRARERTRLLMTLAGEEVEEMVKKASGEKKDEKKKSGSKSDSGSNSSSSSEQSK